MKGKKPTIKDIALQSGYSKTAVSFAFNNPSRISVAAKEKILAVAERLGYIPDPMARNFSLHRHMALGFLLPQNVEHSLGNPYINTVIQGIGIVCQKHGYTLTLIPPLSGSLSAAVRGAMVDGIIAMGMQVGTDVVSIMNTRRIPYVAIDGTPSEGMPSVNIDDEEAAYEMMKLVLSRGHRNIAIVSLTPDAFTHGVVGDTVAKLRARGYERALSSLGIDFRDDNRIPKFTCECSYRDGVNIGHVIASLPTLPTAVVTMSDIVAIGCMTAFKERKIAVPSDISIVGFDNDEASSFVNPSLTTIDQPALQKGIMASEAIFSLVSGNKIENRHMRIPHSLIVRESLGEARKGIIHG